MKSCVLVIAGLCVLSNHINAAKDTTAAGSGDNKCIRILPIPALGYSPETDVYCGAVSLIILNPYNNPNTRISNAKIEFNYSKKQQIIIQADWNYYFNKENFNQNI